MLYIINTRMDTNSLRTVSIFKQKWNITIRFLAGLQTMFKIIPRFAQNNYLVWTGKEPSL